MLLAGVICDMMTDFGGETEGVHMIEPNPERIYQSSENPTQ